MMLQALRPLTAAGMKKYKLILILKTSIPASKREKCEKVMDHTKEELDVILRAR